MEDISRPKKSKTKKKLKIFKALTAVFAILFIVTAGFAVYSAISANADTERLEKQINELRTELNAATNERLSLETQVSKLSSANNELTDKYEKLNSDTAAFQATVSDLQTQLTQLNSENDTLKADLDSVSSKLDKAQDSNSSLTSKNKSLNSQITSLNSTITTLKNENKALRETIENLGATVPEEGGSDEGDDTITESSTSTSTESTKIAYLTFDDGPSHRTGEILDILKQENIKATFFVLKTKDEYIPYLKRAAEEGHTIGVHSASHKYKEIYASVDAYLADFTECYNFIYENTGVEPTIFRFPGGSVNNYNQATCKDIAREMARRGFIYFDWNVESADSGNNLSANTIYNNIINGCKGKSRAVVIMHDSNSKTSTVEALPAVIKQLKADGWQFAALTNQVRPIVFRMK